MSRQSTMRKRRKQQQIRKAIFSLAGFLCLLLVIGILTKVVSSHHSKDSADTCLDGTESVAEGISATENTEEAAVAQNTEAPKVFSAQETADTTNVGDEVVSEHAVLIDLDNGNIVSQKGANERINPASMTKVLTILVAAEHVKDLDDTFTFTLDVTDYAYVNDCSTAGFLDGEAVTVRDLFYGTILPSGGDAAVGLATYVAGSQEAFVEMMNEKIDELGLSDSAHFTNCVGIYDENLYCTVYDMAMILEAAMDNDFCKEVLSSHCYTTSATEQHPEGLVISNWFLRRIEDKETIGTVVCGKTGYVVQAGSCAASYGESADGHGYICVTAGSSSSWQCIYDQVTLYDSVFQ